MGKKLIITKDELVFNVKESISITQVVKKLYNGSYHGSLHKRVKLLIKKYEIDTNHFTGQGWTRGLTKETHPSLKSASEKLINRTHKGTPPTIETKKKLSESRTKYLESHHNHGVKWYDVKCLVSGEIIKVQGGWEYKVAQWLNEQEILFKRTCLLFMQHRKYTPDFYLPTENAYIEVKGFWRDRDMHKLYLVLDEHDIDLRIIDKRNIKKLSSLKINDLEKFQSLFSRDHIDFTRFKNVWSGDGKVDI